MYVLSTYVYVISSQMGQTLYKVAFQFFQKVQKLVKISQCYQEYNRRIDRYKLIHQSYDRGWRVGGGLWPHSVDV